MVKILILSCGTNASWHVVKVLRSKFPNDFYICGTDTNDKNLVPCAKKLDAFYKVPPISSEDYIVKIIEIFRIEHPDYILPSFDADQHIFYDGSEVLRRFNIRSLATPFDTLAAYADKGLMYQAMSREGFPLPKRYKDAEIDAHRQYFVKPITGVGSIGADKCDGIEIIKHGLERHNLIQEICKGPEVTMECFAYNGEFSSVCRERIATKAGVCTKAKVFKSPKLEAIGKKFAECFKTPMFYNLQFMQDERGDCVITDVNLRLAGGMGLSYAAGWDEVSAMAKVLLGRGGVMDTLPEFIPEQYVVRVYDDIPTSVERKTVAFDLDGTLLDSRERHKVVMEDILGEKGLRLDVSRLVDFKRSGKNNLDWLISCGLDSEFADEIQKLWIDAIESEKYLQGDTLYPEAIGLLEKYQGWKCILVTARKNKKGLEETLHRLDIDKYFDYVHVVSPGKKASIEKSEILHSEKVLVFYGDTRSDYEAAMKADVRFVYCEDGFHSKRTVYGE